MFGMVEALRAVRTIGALAECRVGLVEIGQLGIEKNDVGPEAIELVDGIDEAFDDDHFQSELLEPRRGGVRGGAARFEEEHARAAIACVRAARGAALGHSGRGGAPVGGVLAADNAAIQFQLRFDRGWKKRLKMPRDGAGWRGRGVAGAAAGG